MKNLIPLAAVAALAATGQANAQTAYSAPSGYSELTFQAGSDTSFSVPLLRDTAYAGAATSVTGSNTLNLSETPLTAGAWNKGAHPTHYLLITATGSFEGKWFPINSNTTSSITVDTLGENLSTLPAGATFKVIPFWTLGTLFSNGAGAVATTNISSLKTRVYFASNSAGQNIPRTENYVYFDASGTSNDGWYNANNFPAGKQDGVPIFPEESLLVRHPTGVGPTTLVVTGNVLVDTVAITFTVPDSTKGQDVAVGLPYPVDMSTLQTNLFESGVFTPTTNISSIKDRLYIYNNSSTGQNKPLVENYIYFDASGTANDGWYNANNLPAGKQDLVKHVKAATSVVIRKPVGTTSGTYNWVFPSPYVASANP